MNIDLSTYRSLLKIEDQNNKHSVFDPVRKIWVILTPEEIVRQTIIYYLSVVKEHSLRRISVEKTITVNRRRRRYDIVLYNHLAEPILLVECKSPETPLSQTTLDQAAIYNEKLKVNYLWLSNGHTNFLFHLNDTSGEISLIDDFPSRNDLAENNQVK